MAGPDLFVVCKNCGAEVSPYITECPYCGTRLRKRAPKIERDGTISEPKPSRRSQRARPPRAARELRVPGVRAPAWGAKPWATVVVVAASLGMWIALTWVNSFDLITINPSIQPFKLASAAFVYDNFWYELATVFTIGLYGWRLERRHG